MHNPNDKKRVHHEIKTSFGLGLSVCSLLMWLLFTSIASGNSGYSNDASVAALPDPPSAPTALVATPVSSSQINLTWTDNADNEVGFKIERKTGAAGTYTEITTVSANATNYSSTGLTAVTEYFYRVRAYNADGNSAYSDSAGATTLPNLPAAPTNLFATTVSNFQINLAWMDNAANESGFIIERGTASGGPFTAIDTVGADETTFPDTGLSGSTTYYYRVRAYNTAGNSAPSNKASAITMPDPPDAPGSLTYAMVGNTQVDLSWADNANNELGFGIERKTGAGGTYVAIDSVGAGVTSFSNTGLAPGMQYFYRVFAFNGGGNSAYSNEVSVSTPPTPPTAPSTLTATGVSNSQINLAWTDNASNETGFKIERKTGVDGAYTQIATVGADITSYSNTGLTANTQYFYRVRAYNTGGNSSYSNEANATTFIDPPVAPSNLAATTVSNTQIDLAWTDTASTETGFKIERKTGANGTYAEITTVGANVTTFSNTGLNPGVRYFYRVRAFNGTGNSGYSNEANALTLIKPPINLAAVAVGSSQIDLTWTDQTTTETGYSIERKTGIAGTFTEVATVGASVAAFSNTGLDPNTQYFYRVRAFSANNTSPYTNEAEATTTLSPPAAPSNLAATSVSNTQIDLAWTDNAANEDGFKIERKTGANGTYAEITTVGANVTAFSNTGLNPGVRYFYRVRAFNNSGTGNSDYSNEANALTMIKPPINLVVIAVSSSQIDLTWTDQTTTETGYSIERKTGVAGTFAEVATVGANVSVFSNTELNSNTQYFYRVRAFSANNTSPYTNEAEAKTASSIPAAPSNLAATPVSSSQIDLAWTDNASNETGYSIERKTGVNGTFAEIATVGANVTTFSNTALSSGARYFYRVRAFNGNGNSDYSNEANTFTLIKPPTNLVAAAAGSNQIDLTWTDQTATETGYSIERKTLGGTFAEIATVGANVTVFSNNGLDPNTQYFYRVRAFSANNTSPYTNEAEATTGLSTPAAPSNLAATAVSNTQIDLAWTDNATNEDGFKIERKTGVNGAYAEIATVGANVSAFSNTALSAGAGYFYRVRAFNGTGNSGYSNEANALTLIKPPINLAAVAVSSSQIDLTWTDQTATETGYSIERKTGAAGTYAEVTTVGANVTAFSNTGLDPNTQYFYRVRAFSANNTSPYTNEADATTTTLSKESESETLAANPSELFLAPNYPNPFNPSTTISYSLPEGMHVTLTVVNIAGQEVAKLVDGHQERGVHRLTFKAANLPTGIYYAVLRAGEARQVQRMIFAK